MTIVEIDSFEQNGGEFALLEDNFMVLITGPNKGTCIDGETEILPNASETGKTLREIYD
jgi:hypothetical protein